MSSEQVLARWKISREGKVPMLVKIVKSAIVGVVSLLFMQGIVTAATIGVDELEGTTSASVGSPGSFANSGDGTYNDFYLVDLTGSGAGASISISLPEGATSTVDEFTLQLFEVTANDGTDITFSDVAETDLDAASDILLATGLMSGQYILQVVATATDITAYGGEITATPLPPALMIFATGLLGMGLLTRYRRRRNGQLGLTA